MIAKHRGVPATEGLKDAWSKRASRCTRTRSEAYGAGELAKDNEAHIHPGCAGCKFDGCVRKAVELTSGDLPFVSESGLRVERSALTGRQKSAAGKVDAQASKAQTEGSGK